MARRTTRQHAACDCRCMKNINRFSRSIPVSRKASKSVIQNKTLTTKRPHWAHFEHTYQSSCTTIVTPSGSITEGSNATTMIIFHITFLRLPQKGGGGNLIRRQGIIESREIFLLEIIINTQKQIIKDLRRHHNATEKFAESYSHTAGPRADYIDVPSYVCYLPFKNTYNQPGLQHRVFKLTDRQTKEM